MPLVIKKIGLLIFIRLIILFGFFLLANKSEVTSDVPYFIYYINNAFPFYNEQVKLAGGGYGDWPPLTFAVMKLFHLPFSFINNEFLSLRLSFLLQEVVTLLLWLSYLTKKRYSEKYINRFCLIWYITPGLFFVSAIWGQEEFLSAIIFSLVFFMLKERNYLIASIFIAIGVITIKLWIGFLWLILLFYDKNKFQHIRVISATLAIQLIHMYFVFKVHNFIPLLESGSTLQTVNFSYSIFSLLERINILKNMSVITTISQVVTLLGMLGLIYYIYVRLKFNDFELSILGMYMIFNLAFCISVPEYTVWLLPIAFFIIIERMEDNKFKLSVLTVIIYTLIPWFYKTFYSIETAGKRSNVKILSIGEKLNLSLSSNNISNVATGLLSIHILLSLIILTYILFYVKNNYEADKKFK